MKRKLRGDQRNIVNVGYSHRSLQFHRPRLLSILFLLLLLLSPVVYAQSQDVNSTTVADRATTTKPVATSFSTQTTAKASASTNTPTTTLITAPNTPVTIPQPFDTANLDDTGNNFTSPSCPKFIRTFLADASFQACVPFSMLLYDSADFISLTRTGSFAVSQVLDASCGASPKTCGAIMDLTAAKIVSDDACGQDIKAQNPIALQVLTGLQNYLLYYGASCLKDPTTNIYCTSPPSRALFASYTLAITNSTNPADAALYYLPTIRILSGSRPSCSACTQQLFNTYFTFSSNSTLGISKTYLEAAQVMNLDCGLGFVNTSYVAKDSGAQQGLSISWMGMGIVGLGIWALSNWF